jgi:hypothetical protein
MSKRPPMFPLMPLVPMGMLFISAVGTVATWRRLNDLEAAVASLQRAVETSTGGPAGPVVRTS